MGYGRLSVEVSHSTDQAHTDRKRFFTPLPYSVTSDESISAEFDVLSTSERILSFGSFSSSSQLVGVKNSGGDSVLIKWWSNRPSLVLGAGHELEFDDTEKTITLSGSDLPDLLTGVEQGSWISLSGAGLDAGNAGPFLVSSASSTVITVPSSSTLVDESGIVSVTIAVTERNITEVPSGGIVILPGNINSKPLTASSNSGTNQISYFAMGT